MIWQEQLDTDCTFVCRRSNRIESRNRLKFLCLPEFQSNNTFKERWRSGIVSVLLCLRAWVAGHILRLRCVLITFKYKEKVTMFND